MFQFPFDQQLNRSQRELKQLLPAYFLDSMEASHIGLEDMKLSCGLWVTRGSLVGELTLYSNIMHKDFISTPNSNMEFQLKTV